MAIVPNRYLPPGSGMGINGLRPIDARRGFRPMGGGGMGNAGPVSIYANRGMFGAGGHDTLHDLLAGISLGQLQRMQHGRNPGGFGGDFVGISPARLKLLANLMVANQQAGPVGQDGSMAAPPQFHLEYTRGDGLFAGRKMPIRPGLGQPGHPQQPHGFQGGASRAHGLRNALMMRALGGLR